ncbi:Rab family GTPase [Promethearchaeum syntrophicum]|uniref:Rab family GTPase n=1 Tax=Promethearchaeum syntrophicum TaxID=2594042 RepID=A0A5B9DAH6_9ARCH|nr:Rab family GTPase [Candidatus Prometheoarchaeum syntrophicum]QEE15596.1 Ras family protein [Candidatus Prometheoarchaeum syntrophicum]
MMQLANQDSSYNIEDSEEDIKYQFKIVLLGDGGCGKTALTNRFCFNEFDVDTKLTIGLSFNSFSIPAEEDGIKIRIGLSIWDFGGQERFTPLLPQFITGANAALIVHDLTRFVTLENLKRDWNPLLISNAGDVPRIMVGTKLDLIDPEYKFDPKTLEDFQKELGVKASYDTSSKTGFNVDIIFKELVKQILKIPPYDKKNVKII